MADVDVEPGKGERVAIDRVLQEIGESVRTRRKGKVGEAIAYALSGGGKRVRGLLALASYRACGGTGDATRLAAAVEIVHAYSLVHDDLPCMDDDDMRRGRLTVHRKFDVPTATTVGLAMIPLAAQVAFGAAVAIGAGSDGAQEIVKNIMRASGAHGMVGGQLMDLESEGRRLDGQELDQIHRAKTGALIESCVVIGAMGARADSAQLAALRSYGEKVGLAFQIADDVLDVTGTTAQLGKTVGRDAARQKTTYPALLGVDQARQHALAMVDEACRGLAGLGFRDGGADLVRLARYAVMRTS